MEQTELLRLVRKGDPLAWEAFVRQRQGRVFGLAYHYVAHAEDARDLTQEVFIRIYQSRGRVPEAAGLVGWLVRVTRNACLDFRRRRQARPPAWDIPVEELCTLTSAEPGPEEAHLETKRREQLHLALRGLSELNREMIVLKEIQGLAIEEIARLLEVPVGTVKSRSSRARLELAERLAALEGGG